MTYEILVPSFMQSLKTRELIMTGRRARRRISRWSVSPISSISFFFLLSCFSLLICSARGTITPTRQVIRDGETLISAGKKFELGFFNPGGATSTTNKRYLGIWYYGLSHDIPRTVVWVANGESPAVNTLASLAISRNGNLEVLDDIGNVLWSTSVFNITTNSTSTKLMDSGNLILSGGENEDDNIIWQSFSQESDTFLPGMKMDVNKKLRSWANEHDPAPGNLTFELNQDGNQIRFVIRNTSAIHWRSGSTNDFSNSNQMPEFVAYMLSNFSATSRRETPLKSPSPRFHIPNPSPSYVFNNLRLVMHPSGEIRFYNLSNNKLSWDLLWKGPSDNCSVYNVCGDYGSCNSTNKPVCKCLQGFIPKSRENWDSGEFSGGCIRKLPGCEKDDEFLQLKVKNVGNPYFNYSPQAQEECKAECLSKCSCNAYSFSNNSRRGRGVSSTCWIWNDEDLKDLQEGVSDRSKDIYVRVASSDLEPICKSNKDCEHWPDSTCLPSTTGNGKRRCLCNTNHAWDSSSKSCTRAVDSTLNKTHPSEPDHSAHNTKTLSSIVGVTVATGIILSFAIIFVCYLKRRKRRMDKRKAHRENIQEGSTSHFDESDKYAEQIDSNKFGIDEKKGIDVPFYDFESIMEATENFSKSNKLGQGGFGPVYKGKFLGGEEMAVKRLSRSSGQGLQEFKNEVLLIAKLQHRNLVKLLGYSIKGDEYMLLYEYMPNKSLDFFIFDPTRCLLLNWEKRFNIIMGIARGLLYLHQDSRLRIIHRDLKTSNILLDEEMNPKISDFGLARIFGGNQTEANTNRVVGTYGYMSPEYALNGIFSDKSDVFSFGIVLLEIVSGKKNTGTGVYQTEHSLSLLAAAWTLWKEDKVLDLMDKSLCEAFNAFEVSKCINIGLLCVQDDADDRPTMSNVVFMLGSETTTLPTPKQPAFVGKMGPSNTASSSSKPETYSVTELTITAEQGR